ncbi:hypothetical protein ABK040_012652 [Willaertia magna]
MTPTTINHPSSPFHPTTNNTSSSFNPSSSYINNNLNNNFYTNSNQYGTYTYRKYLLQIHEKEFSEQEILVNGKVLNWIQKGDILEIIQPKNMNVYQQQHLNNLNNNNLENQQQISSSPIGNLDANNIHNFNNINSDINNSPEIKPLVIKVNCSVEQTMKGIQHISILKSIADVFEFQNRKEILVRIIPKEHAILDYVVFSIKDHFLSRSDMWRFSLVLNDTCVYESKIITWHGGVRVQVKELMKKDHVRVNSGIIVYGYTKISFRSRSAVIYWLFQMSKEMWEYDEFGNLYFERVINGFIKTVFDKWREVGVNHSLSIVLFSRHFLVEDTNNSKDSNKKKFTDDESLGNKTSILHSLIGTKDGRKYVDFFKVVDWNETQRTRSQFIRTKLQQEFLQFKQMIDGICQREQVTLQNSSAADGNFMEAINLVLNSFDKYYINRDLSRTGQVILLISPGCGMFDVQIPLLGKITTKRLMDVGLSVDLIAFSVPPLHSVPIFRYKKRELVHEGNNTTNNTNNNTITKEYTYYRSPDWINISFYRENYFRVDLEDSLIDSFLPINRMPNFEGLPTSLPLFEKYSTFCNSLAAVNNSSTTTPTSIMMNMNAVNSGNYIYYSPMNFSGGGTMSNVMNNSVNLNVDLFRIHDDSVFRVFNSHNRSTNSGNSSSGKGMRSSFSNDNLNLLKKRETSTDSIVSLDQSNNVNNNNNTEITTTSVEQQEEGVFVVNYNTSNVNNNNTTPQISTTINNTVNNNNSSVVHSNSGSSVGSGSFNNNSINITPNTNNHTNNNNNLNNNNNNSSNSRRLSPHNNQPFMAELAERHKVKELFYMKLYNPFHMDKSQLSSPENLQLSNQQNTFHRRRWAHLHPSSGLRPTQKAEYIKHFLLHMNWRGLIEPACLPLSTDYFPDHALKILNDFDLHTHSVYDTNDIYQNNIGALVRELVCQRLHQGFQLYSDDVPKDPTTNQPITIASTSLHQQHKEMDNNTTDSSLNNSNVSSNNNTTIVGDTNNPEKSNDTSSGNSVTTTTGVTRGRGPRGRARGLRRGVGNRLHPSHTHSNTNSQDGSSSSNCTSHASESTKPQKQRPQKMEYLLSSANQFHRITYNPYISNVVTINRYVPKEKSNAVNNIIGNSSNTSLSSLNKESPVNTNKESNVIDPFNSIKSSYTYRYMLWNPTLNSYECRITKFNSQVGYNWNKLDYLICGDHEQMTYELHNRSLQFHLIPITSQNRHLFTSTTQLFGAFNNNSSNSPILTNNNGNSEVFNYNELQAEFSERLKNFKKFIESITCRNFRYMSKEKIEVLLIDENASIKQTEEYRSKHPTLTTKLQYHAQEHENSFSFDDRVEWIHFVYKSTYHPSEFWTFKIQWLVCTAAIIDEYLQSLARRARQCGFAMVQTPAEIESYAIYSSNITSIVKETDHDLEYIHPFRSFVRIPIPSIEVMNVVKNQICEAPFNFIPEITNRKESKRFIHNSGCIILYIDNIDYEKGFVTWIDNPFQTFDLSIAPLVNQSEILTKLRKLIWSELYSDFVKY